MKHFFSSLPILAIWLFYSPTLHCQNYLNIRYLDGSDKNVPFGSLQTITFNGPGDKINFILTDATTQVVAFSTIQSITMSDLGAGTLLPVELDAFNATANRNTVSLSWRTATEANNYGFNIERRAQSLEWEKIGFVQGHGNSSSPNQYSFADAPQRGTKFQYRLKQIDNDGKFRYSDIVSIDIEAPVTYELKQNFPNPFNPQTTIAYNIPRESFVTIKVYDVLGKEVASLVNENKKAGSYELVFDGSRLSSGVYVCKMSAAAISSANKMIIMK